MPCPVLDPPRALTTPLPPASLPDQPLPPSLSNRVAHLNAPESSKQAYLQTTQRAPAESFIILNQPLTSPPSLPPGEKPTKQTLLTLLLDLVSARTDTDHPLCTECARLLQDALTTQLEEVSFERDAFIGFERTVKEEGKGKKSREDIKELERVLAEVRFFIYFLFLGLSVCLTPWSLLSKS